MLTTKERAFELMKISMPPFEKFLEHGSTLKAECEQAGELTDINAVLFDQYKDALFAARGEYEDSIATLICEHFSNEEIDQLLAFYASPLCKTIEKALSLGAVVNNLGTEWQTKVLERCPDAWQMIVTNVGKWQEKNVPPNIGVSVPNNPPGVSGWNQAEEYKAPINAA